MEIFGYRGNAIKVNYSNFEEKEAIINEVVDKGAFVMSPLSYNNNSLYITGIQQNITYHLTELNFQNVDFEELGIEFVNGEHIEDISLIEVID